MKAIKLTLLVMAATLMAFGLSTGALAFHDGGVAHCDGCHTMHNSNDGQAVGPGGGDLTIGSDPSSTCLNCHGPDRASSYDVLSNDGSKFSAGGDFYWMTKTFQWSAHGRPAESNKDNHGHNVVALDFGLTVDNTLTQAPGGTYNAAALSCTSCHDPHGKKNQLVDKPIRESGSYGAVADADTDVGNFRLLGDDGYDAGSNVTFNSEVPIAYAPSLSADETDGTHVDYGQNMSEWCANCHGTFSGAGKHPSGNNAELSDDDIYINYNTYVKTGDMTGSQATAYLALVPFERGTNDPTTLSPTSTSGPNGTANVMCLSCHRAHATAFDNATRWDMTTEFPATDSHPAPGDTGVTGDDVLNSYYGRDMVAQFGAYQRSLCNKCHAQD